VSPEAVVLSVDHMAFWGPHRISMGPLDHEGATVAFEWDTETLLTEQNI